MIPQYSKSADANVGVTKWECGRRGEVYASSIYTTVRLNLEVLQPGRGNDGTWVPIESFADKKRSCDASVWIKRSNSKEDGGCENTKATINGSLDENDVEAEHIACESSIFLRDERSRPRCILWRLLERGKIIEFYSVDVWRNDSNTKKYRTPRDVKHDGACVRIRLAQAVRPYGIGLADAPNEGEFRVFVLTTSKDIYTICVQDEVLRHCNATEKGITCHVFQSQFFTLKQPYRLFVLDANGLGVSTHDGSFILLRREVQENGKPRWRERFFTDGSWSGALKSLVAWGLSSTHRYGGINLNATCAIDAKFSPSVKHMFTVGLDHVLRGWNLSSGRVEARVDLVYGTCGNEIRDNDGSIKLEAGQKMAMQMLPFTADLGDRRQICDFYIVTYSANARRFMVWGVQETDSLNVAIFDAFSDFEMQLSLEDYLYTSAWCLEEFYWRPTKDWKRVSIWLRVRAGAVCKIFQATVNMHLNVDEFKRGWQNGWKVVDGGGGGGINDWTSVQSRERGDGRYDGIGVCSNTEAWLNFLFWGDRFSEWCLEWAFKVYVKEVGMDENLRELLRQDNCVGLKERIWKAIDWQVKSRRGRENWTHRDLENAYAMQWHLFYGLIRNLQKRRGEVLSMVHDGVQDVVWIIQADYVCFGRRWGYLEGCQANGKAILACDEWSDGVDERIKPSPRAQKSKNQMCKLVVVAHEFMRGFPDEFYGILEERLCEFTGWDGLDDGGEAMCRFESVCGLCSFVTEEQIEKLREGFALHKQLTSEYLSDDLWEACVNGVMTTITTTAAGSKGKYWRDIELTRIGRKGLIRSLQDMVIMKDVILVDLLVLVVYLGIERESNEEEARVNADFNARRVFQWILVNLRDLKLMKWLVGRTIEQSGKNGGEVLTVYEKCLIGRKKVTMEGSLGDNWTTWAQKSIVEWRKMTDRERREMTMKVVSKLLQGGKYREAEEFLGYTLNSLSCSGVGEYFMGRLELALGEPAIASKWFQRSAWRVVDEFYGGRLICLVDDDHNGDDEESCVDDGMVATTSSYFECKEQEDLTSGHVYRYYDHISGLFAKKNYNAQVIEFGNLALQSYGNRERDDDYSGWRDTMLERLFDHSLQSYQDQSAYMMMIELRDERAKEASLEQFIKWMINRGRGKRLMEYPFTRIEQKVEKILVKLCNEYVEDEEIGKGKKHVSIEINGERLGEEKGEEGTVVSWHKILYSWRIRRDDFRGAARVIYDRLRRLEMMAIRRSVEDEDLEALENEIFTCYLVMINCLSCVDKDEAWILVNSKHYDSGRERNSKRGGSSMSTLKTSARSSTLSAPFSISKRTILTLEDIRQEYQDELDRISAVENGQIDLISIMNNVETIDSEHKLI